MKVNSGKRLATLTRSLMAGLSAVAMAAAMSAVGPQEAKALCAASIDIGANFNGNSGTTLCFGNIGIGFNNFSDNGNGLGGDLIFGNIGVGLNNGSQDGNSLVF